MADTETPDLSLVAPVAVLPIQTVAWETTNLEKCEHEVIENLEASVNHPHEVTQSPHPGDSQQPSRDLSQSLSSDEAKIDSLSTSIPAVIQRVVDSPFVPVNIDITEKPKDVATGPNTELSSSIPSTANNSPVQQYAIATHPLHAPQIKRFTSVNITKRFLEKTSSMSGPSLGTGSLSNTSSALSSSNQHRGISPNSRSPSFDRPVSSRLVTAKLTAVPQPSSASTSGWLRPGQTTNSNTTPTPPSLSPQPPLHESTATSLQAIKRRSGTSPAPNGVPISTGSQNNKLAWAKSTAAPSNSAGRSVPGLDNKSDFPTAAEAVHSMQTLRKGKPGKGQTEADTAAAAHKAAQRNAMNETAAAFRGAHLDVNARWDEMSDEDSEDFDGVIEFGDGTQYKIEHKPNSSQGIPQERSATPFEPEGPPVAKEERFGEDMGRNWPRQTDPAVGQPSIDKPSLRLSVSSHPISEAISQAHSPHDGVSPTSRVLFNERLNRLEPLSESKAPFGSRQREPVFTSPTYPSNIQLLQKSLPGTDIKNRGPFRTTGPGAERSPWADGPLPRGPPSVKNDERPWESRRRESMSSATGSSIRDRSRGRDRWVPPYHTTGDRDNLHGAFAPPTSMRERDGDRTNHLRPPLFAPVSPKGLERDNLQSNFSAASPTVSSRSLHSPVLEKSLLAASQPPDNSEDIDKNVLLKSAMHVANERARRRKQELDEEEKRREEAAERARKKAEALAHAMGGKEKSEGTSSEPPKQPKSDEQTEVKTATAVSTSSQQASQEQLTKRLSTDHSSAPPLLLSRKTTTSSLGSQAESWRSKAPPKSVATETQSTEGKAEVKPDPQAASSLRSSDNPLVPSFPSTSPNDLLIKPDEDVEVVDFEDLGKFLGNAPQEPSALPKALSRLSSRPVASDFFGEDSVEHEAKTEVLSWRRPTVKPQLTPSADGLRTQTVPIFSTVSSPEAELPTMDPKTSQSPLLSPSKRLSQGDYAFNNPQISPVLSALRSPRASHFKEASMSALTDTMSRIKGALDGMQSHDILTAKDRGKQSVPEVSRTFHNGAPQQQPLTSEWEEFVTCIPPPSSPKPVWKTHTVKIPRVSQIREPLPRRQARLWNQPYPTVRWDILSWDPPVEGMNKRDLSRDDIFHKKINLPKGGKLRVVLPPPIYQRAEIFQTSLKDTSTDPTTLVTAMGIKIKLPSGSSSFGPAISIERTRDVFNVSSWRGSAIPSTSLKNEQSRVIAAVPNEELNTTSRSPPPDPFTPLPQLTPTKRERATSSEGPLAANVSLPPTDNKALREPVSFLRTKDVVNREQSTSTPLPSFTVNSELEPFTPEPSDQAVKVPITNSSPAPSKTELKSPPSQAFTSAAHELPRLIASKPGSKSSEESATRPGTPPSSTQHATSPWGKALAFPVVKDSPTRRGPDPEHLKAVWSLPTSIPTGSTSNSLQDITDEQLPSIPSTMQDMKSEGGETPPPMAPAPPTRLSQQEVARAFQQVPESPASRPPTYPQSPLFPQYHRPNHSMPLSHPARPSYPPSYHPHAVMGHSPSPTLMYATGMDSPVLHQRLPMNGHSPSVASGVWLSTPPGTSQQGSYLRPAGAPPPPTQMVYPPSGTTPNQMVPHRMAIMGHGSMPPAAPPAIQAGGLYAAAPMPDMRNMQNMHVRSPHLAHTTPAHPHAVQMQTMHPAMFSPPPPPGHAAQPQTMYALPAGANRGAMLPRGYEGYHAMPPHAGYPTTPYMYPS